jgi:NAD(P)-dependent dehydrogenase (short-subunit alcohol dehydrogenase family)
MAPPWWFIPRFLWEQWTRKLPYPTTSFSDQTIIVTGANIGLGLEAARHFVRLGAAKVILAVRSAEKGEVAKQSIEQTTGRTGVVEVWSLDLCSFESVKEFAKKVQKLERLDVLLENAAINTMTWKLAEGHESTITTNVISTFLLALLLLPKLKETAQKFNKHSRLTIVASEAHFMSTLQERNYPSGSILSTLADPAKHDKFGRYNVSKLLEILTIREITSEEAKPPYSVTINCVNPGLCHSALGRELGSWKYVFMWVMGARSTEEGARTLVHAVTLDDSHGRYLSAAEIQDPSPFVLSEEGKVAQKRVWAELKELLDGISPGVSKNV